MLKLKKSAADQVTYLNEYTRRKKKEEEETSDLRLKGSAVEDIAPVTIGYTDEDDVAPVVTSSSNGKRTWFQKGAFEDGYQFGDITKTILGTTQDVETNLLTGLARIPEAVIDAAAYVLPYGATPFTFGFLDKSEKFQKYRDTVEEAVTGFVSKDLINEEEVVSKLLASDPRYVLTDKLLGVDTERDSVLGEKSDAVVQSGGQLLGTIGLQALGVPWWLTTGVTSFGTQAETALNDGASFGEAGVSAAISAAAEVLSEKLSGGIKFGGNTLDDVLLKPLTERIASKGWKLLANFGIDAFGEGFEEIVSGFFSNLGTALYKEEDLSDILFSEQAMDEYLESFIGGAALGGFSSGVQSVKPDVAQDVITKEYNDRVDEVESTQGRKTTAKEKSKIYNEVVEDVESGYISVDRIEEILGEKELAEYDKLVKESEEFDELYNTESGKLSAKQQDRLNELKAKNEANPYKDAVPAMRKGISQDIYNRVQGTRLNESYNEYNRKRQLFEDDADRYKDKYAKQTVQSIIESKAANNSKYMRQFVETATRIAKDKKLVFSTTNDEILSNSGVSVDNTKVFDADGTITEFELETKALNKYLKPVVKVNGKEVTNYTVDYDTGVITFDSAPTGQVSVDYKTMPRIHGIKNGNKITINLSSNRAWQTTVGHELVHVLKTEGDLKTLQDAIFKLAKDRGEYDSRLKEITEAYKKYDPTADPKEELLADLVGEYLFQDEAFVKRLSVENRNLFQRIWDEIKYLLRVVTARSEEARELQRIERMFEDAYRASGKTQSDAKGDTQYSLSDSDGRQLTTEQQEYFKDSKVRDENGNLKVMYHGTSKGGFNIFDTYGSNYGLFGVGSYFTDNESVAESYTNKGKGTNKQVYVAYLNITNPMDMDAAANPAEWAKAFPDTAFPESGTNEDFYRAVERYYSDQWLSKWEVAEEIQSAIESIMGYDGITHIGGGRFNKNDPTRHRVYIAFQPEQIKNINNTKPTANANIHYSLSDSNGRSLTNEQFEYFIDSKIRDENGNLQVMYHGSPAAFTMFDKKKAKSSGYYGRGFYFTNSDSHAKQYGNTYEVYLNITNPLQSGTNDITKEQLRKFVEAIAENEDYGIDNYGYGATVDSVTDSVFGKDDFAMLMDINASCVGDMVAAIELFNEVNGTDYNGIITPTETVAFYPEQIKSVDNKTPTSDPDIRYSLSENTQDNGVEYAPVRNTATTANNITAPVAEQTAQILTEEPKQPKKKSKAWKWAKEHLLDSGMVFEDLSLKTGNRELQARWNSIRYADKKAQKLIGDGDETTKSLNSIKERVEKSGKTQQFYAYLYHMHNADRMTLSSRFGVEDKPVFGSSVTAEMSKEIASNLAKNNPEFKRWAEDVYAYNRRLRSLLVQNGVISVETAKLWEQMYPHYVPIRREGDVGLNVNVPLDTGRTGINAPVKRATGGNGNILPLFDTMGQRTMQTYKAIAKKRFGVELMNTLGTTIENQAVGVDEVIDSIDTQDSLLQEGINGRNPTFTVFENGEKVTFEITDEMYEALKPTSELFASTSKVLNTASNLRRSVLTEYNPWFMLKNAVKDVQDVLINSQHPAKTYAAIPSAIREISTKGRWYQEYMANGGEQNTYFDKQSNTFAKENPTLEAMKKWSGLNFIQKANNIVEMIPRLSEYIASREAGRSIDVSMLDAARVTTNFAAGGDVTKWLNRNGATFLNASVQGVMQQARNIREAKMNGLRGWASLAAKFTIAGLPAIILNNLIWDDDEDYAELSDYVKEGYYIVGKFGDGKFVRIPKGRTVAVIQNAFEQISNAITGDDEVDLKAFVELVISNLAPNNPLENNIFSPIVQVAKNETWYGEDLVPTRLQDLPASEQYDESTDMISRWLGETFNISPYKVNYLIDQYSGVIGDTFLPMLTPEAESGDDSFLGNMIAPLKDMFITDSVMKNQNVSDFYETKDELAVNAKASNATDEDVLKYKYLNTVNAELSDLYKQKREIQNSDLPDAQKYEAVREIQRQIDAITENAMNTYESVVVENGNYANIGDYHYRKNESGEWQRITDEQLEKQNAVTEYLGISPAEYWNNKEECDYAYKNPEKYNFLSKNGITYEQYKNADDDFKDAYDWAFDNPDGYLMSRVVAGDVVTYRQYTSDLYNIHADKDANGKSISGSRKSKVIEYINNMDIDRGQKLILLKSEYPSTDTYNYEIIEYLNNRDDISFDEMKTILIELGFTVDANGNVSW